MHLQYHFIFIFPAFCNFPIRQNFHVIFTYQAVALGQSGNIYLSIDPLYPLGASLTGSPFELASPLLALRGGRGARDPNIIRTTMASSKKRCFSAALETPFNDEQNTTSFDKWPRFITLEAEQSDQQSKPLTKISPFLIQKGLQGIIGNPKSIKKLKSGALLIEVAKQQHSTSLLTLKDLAGIPVIGRVHNGLNQSKGILFDRDHDLDDIPEQEIQQELESQGVVNVKRFTKKRNEIIEPTNTYLLTFGMPTLPKNIKVGFYHMKIDVFVPNPLRCFKCQRFGHGQRNCKSSEACFRCGEEGHDGTTCHKDHKCRNCKGDHMASSKKCPIWMKEKEIQKVKAEKRIPYHEAKKLINMYSVPKPNLPSYATVVKSSSTKDMSTQVCESDILPQTSVTTTNSVTSKKNSTSTSPGSTSAPGKSVATGPAEPVAADIQKQAKRRNSSPKNKSKQYSDRLPKGAKDPVAVHNKFGALEEMECTTSHSSSRTRSLSPKNKKGGISPIRHKKS